MIGGALAFLAALVAHEILKRLRHEDWLSDRLAVLARGQHEAAAELRRWRAAPAPASAPGKNGREVAAVIAEVKVLQSLVEQLYAQRQLPVAPPPLAPDDALPPPPARMPTPVERLDRAPPPGRNGAGDLAVLDELHDGLREDRIELALQPIVGLPQRKRRHFECFSWVRNAEGGFLLPERYIGLAEEAGLIGTVDNMLLIRCVQLLRRGRHANPTVGFFCNISPHTLADGAFFGDFVAFMRQNAELAANIVFEFPQRTVAAGDTDLDRDLGALASLGFRFSLDQVSDLDLDPEALGGRGFRFVKIEAARLLPGAHGGAGAGEAQRLRRRLDRHGMDLIVEKIETEATLVELLDLNVDYGQGYLFGEPKLARIDR